MNSVWDYLPLEWLLLLLVPVVVVNEVLVEWLVAMWVGGYPPGMACEYAIESVSAGGVVFMLVLRVIPYLGLGAVLVSLSVDARAYMLPVFTGGVAGAVISYVWFTWSMYVPVYTGGPWSSTWAIGFVATPIFTVPATALGAGLGAGIYRLVRGAPPGPLPPPPSRPPEQPEE